MDTKLFFIAAVCLMAIGADACICTMDYRPVCGVDGITYDNLCELNCESVQKKHDGACPKTDCPCPRNLDYVCGDDGLTYDNHCLMRCNGATEAYPGQC
ncbi:serine protease inhibitor dipetalogastin-like [Dreissena polymorpha]|uniref:Kazal-like domain-containing protein n=1 Tax=Dreissena polymorpha TaxID=45954 RepID=A0A9D4HNI3_DREPO|nr:serine protease inhibitor dipetalogastin-like [Dreissena polymorpha]KAH3725065.1 hypothetical protein DPMN_050894 [Dreissena polymorpha]